MSNGPLLYGVLTVFAAGVALWVYGRWYAARLRRQKTRGNIWSRKAANDESSSDRRKSFVFGNANVDISFEISEAIVQEEASKRWAANA